MDKEELEKEADKYADGYATPDLNSDFRAYMFEASKEGYLAGAESREKRIEELEAQIERMKNNCLDLMRVQSFNLTDDYMAGMYNGMTVVYNSCFLDDFEKKGEGYCHRNNLNKWTLEEIKENDN